MTAKNISIWTMVRILDDGPMRGMVGRITGYRGDLIEVTCEQEKMFGCFTPFGIEVFHGFQSGLDPIPDPFAPGEYVTCIVESGGHGKVRGDVLLVDEYIHPTGDWFCSLGWPLFDGVIEPLGFQKSNFRASTPEEIAAYKAKQTASNEECSEPTLNNENSVGCESNEEPRVTFMVGGQEFFIGQRVWGTRNCRECVKEGQEAEICGHRNFNLAVRVLSDSYVYELPKDSLQFSPPTPHEWKRGDWARHEKRGVGFVLQTRREYVVLSFSDETAGEFLPSELTFITHTEIPE